MQCPQERRTVAVTRSPRANPCPSRSTTASSLVAEHEQRPRRPVRLRTARPRSRGRCRTRRPRARRRSTSPAAPGRAATSSTRVECASPGRVDERLHYAGRTEHGAVGGRADERAVAREHAAVVPRRRAAPARQARARARPRRARRRARRASTSIMIDVAVAHGRERPAARGLGRDVADHQAARGAREAPVGDERDRLAEPGADDGRGDAQHLAHARARRPAPRSGRRARRRRRPRPTRTASAHASSLVEDARRARGAPPASSRRPSRGCPPGARLPRSACSAPLGLNGALER